MNTLAQYVIVGALVLLALAYVVWRLGPARLRRRLGRAENPAADSCSSCSASTPLPHQNRESDPAP